jgi:hypothetical protein
MGVCCADRSACAAALTLSIGAAVIKGASNVTQASDADAKLQLASNAWVEANDVMLLILVMVPVVVNAVPLAMCVYTTVLLMRGA